ncbi:MAG: tetratricopeptide repeat protein [Anaerolineae bacterium]
MSDFAEFQQFMEEGHSAAWEGNWGAAIESYSKAVQASSDNADAHINLGIALRRDGQLDRSLKVFRRAQQLAPDDPVPIEGLADVLESMGQLKEAAQQYVKVSDIYLAQRDIKKAISNWEHATQLTPGLVSVHARLAQAYERVGRKEESIREYLTLAYNFQHMDDDRKALRAVERALSIDKSHAEALNALRAVKSGGEIVLPKAYLERKVTPVLDDEVHFDDSRADVGEAHPMGPMGEALENSLVMLAEFVVEGELSEFVMYAMQGMELQRQDDLESAVNAYIEASQSGLQHPALKMNIGGLLVMVERSQDAIPYLESAVNDPLLTAGALHALGKAYYQIDKQKEASAYLIQSLRAVDTGLASTPREEQELIRVYTSLMNALDGRDAESLKIINERFIGLLSGSNWKQRISQTRIHLDETLKDEGDQGMVDYLKDGGDGLTDLVTIVDRYKQLGLYTLAMDQAHYAVEISPWYLPVHVRMAELMMKEGRIRQAINKYNMVARSYLVREENERAAVILQEVLEMAPLDVDVRVNLIQLLEDEDRWDEALDNYINLAETYQQLGDFERASETFQASERLARRINADPAVIVKVKHFIADIHQMRLNTSGAQVIYEEILEVEPTNEKALNELIDIYYNKGNQVEAIKRLDTLLGYYAQNAQVDKIVKMLEKLVNINPDDAALRQRLASIYRRRGQKKEAIEQLDALGELQLDAGLTSEAAKTIKQIISMNPDRLDDYKKLLAQLGG